MMYTKIIDNSKILDENFLNYLITEISQDHLQDERNEYLLLYIFKDESLNQAIVDKKLKEKGLTFKIYLMSIENILKEKQKQVNLPDSANISIIKNKDIYEVKILNYFSPYLKKKIDEENNRRVKKTAEGQIKISESGYELIEYLSFDTNTGTKWVSELEDKAEIASQIKGLYELKTNKFKLKIRNIAGDEIIIDSGDCKHE